MVSCRATNLRLQQSGRLDLGFTQEGWLVPAVSFRQLAASGSIVNRVETAHGSKYTVDGRIGSPSGKTPVVRTIWIVDRGVESPRLVTAYPREG